MKGGRGGDGGLELIETQERLTLLSGEKWRKEEMVKGD